MRKVFIIALIFLANNLLGQTAKTQSKSINQIFQIADSTRVQIEHLKSRVNIMDSILTSVVQNKNSLKQENEILKTTVDTNSNIFNGISAFLTIVSILLTIVVIAIPLINYFLVLKPNQKMVEKVENLNDEVLKTLEGNFESYFEKLRRQKTNKILSMLDDKLKLPEVTGYFLLNDSDNLEEADILKIIDFLSSNKDIEKTDASILNSIVIESGFFIAEKYYKSILEKDDNKNFEYAIEYLVDNDFEENVPYIEKIIKANDMGHYLLIEFFDYIQEKYIGNWMDKKMPEKKEISIKYAKLLFDNDNILKAIENKEVPKDKHGFREHPININRLNDNSYLRETKYYKVYLEKMDKKYK